LGGRYWYIDCGTADGKEWWPVVPSTNDRPQ
jgi:hypothetical protein